MDLKEWISLGIGNGIVSSAPVQEVTFEQAYKAWFLMKLNVIKSQSCDRLECTYNRHFSSCRFVNTNVSAIDEAAVSDFLTFVIVGKGGVTFKEFRRIYQIVNNVMVYAKDVKLGGARLLDWDVVKRYVPEGKFVPGSHRFFAVPVQDIRRMRKLVVEDNIYPLKRSACLCLILNFYLGLRVGELAALTWRDVDDAAGVVRICKTEIKTYSRDEDGRRCGAMVYRVAQDTKTVCSVREVPLLPEAVLLLQLLKKHHAARLYQSPYLAYDGSGCILTRSLDRTLRRLCDLCQINRFGTHAIRKTFATMLHMSGVPTRYISDLLGHSEMLTTERNYILGYRDNHDTLLACMQRSLTF